MNITVPTEFPAEFVPGNVKAAMKDAAASSGDNWKVPLDKLVIMPGLNVRTEGESLDAHILGIAKSMLQEGFYPHKPLGIFVNDQNQIVVADGHNRVRAALLANKMGGQITHLPCIPPLRGTTMADITIGLIKSNEGKPLTPLEKATVCRRLLGFNWDIKQVAERLDYTVGYVNELLSLLEAPQALQQLVSAGKVSADTAVKAIKAQGAVKAAETITKVVAESKTGKVGPAAVKAATDIAKAKDKAATKGSAKSSVKPKVVADPMKILAAVFNDKGFSKLSDKTQQMVLEIFG